MAVSLRTRQILWSVPLGTSEGLENIGIRVPPDIPGAINLGGPITTAGGLVFIGAALDRYFRARAENSRRVAVRARGAPGDRQAVAVFSAAATDAML